MVSKITLNLQFQRPECRAEFEKARHALKSTLHEGGAEEGAARLLDLGAALDAGVARMKRDLLGSSLCWNEDNQAVTAWIHQQHRKVEEMGARIVDSLSRDHPDSQVLARVIALTLFHWAEAVKWIGGRERQNYEPLHDMLERALSCGAARESMNWVADGRGHTVTIEALYFRALLLDRFASGSLTRQQVEVLDAWLWQWAPQLLGVDTYPGGSALRVDLDANAGLRDGRRETEGKCSYLRLEPLEAQRRAIVRELQRGRIVPAHGCTAEFRIEEHVAVLDYLQRAFRTFRDAESMRAARQPEAGVRIEVWVGIAEILERGAGIRQVGTETGRWRALSLADPISLDKNPANKLYDKSPDVSRRFLWLSDRSATGHGFEALEPDAAGIEVGALLGWRRTGSSPLVLGRVIRRLPSATAGQVFIGVQLLTETGLPITLARADAFDRDNADITFLFVAGDDDTGRRDAFLLPESTYQQQHTYQTRAGGGEPVMLRFNRIRAKGRGWLLAGFEIVPPKRAEAPRLPASGEPEFELVLDPIAEERLQDPWSQEVSARLG